MNQKRILPPLRQIGWDDDGRKSCQHFQCLDCHKPGSLLPDAFHSIRKKYGRRHPSSTFKSWYRSQRNNRSQQETGICEYWQVSSITWLLNEKSSYQSGHQLSNPNIQNAFDEAAPQNSQLCSCWWPSVENWDKIQNIASRNSISSMQKLMVCRP